MMMMMMIAARDNFFSLAQISRFSLLSFHSASARSLACSAARRAESKVSQTDTVNSGSWFAIGLWQARASES